MLVVFLLPLVELLLLAGYVSHLFEGCRVLPDLVRRCSGVSIRAELRNRALPHEAERLSKSLFRISRY
jgi:hypothetical protein